MRIDKNSYGTVLFIYAMSATAIFSLFRWVGIWWIEWPLALGLIWVCGWQTMFHMVPERKPAGSDTLVSAVTDGKIVHINRVFEGEWLKREAIMVSIYMDFWDIHANFWPVTGTVTYTQYHPGKHWLAFKPKASEENEHTCTSIRNSSGTEVFFKQLAGGFARRIVCYAKPGLEVVSGNQCGIIKFGSRIDIYLPTEAEILCEIGQVVRAAETVIARI